MQRANGAGTMGSALENRRVIPLACTTTKIGLPADLVLGLTGTGLVREGSARSTMQSKCSPKMQIHHLQLDRSTWKRVEER